MDKNGIRENETKDRGKRQGMKIMNGEKENFKTDKESGEKMSL